MGIDRTRHTAPRALSILRRHLLSVGSRGLLVLCIACASSSSYGCRATGKTSGADAAMTPQERAHREQLAAMGREDAAATSKSALRTRPTTPLDRRSGQRTIDQPRR